MTHWKHLGWAFTYRRNLHCLNELKRPEALEVGEAAGKVYDYLVSPRYRRQPRVHLHRLDNRMCLHLRQLSMRGFAQPT